MLKLMTASLKKHKKCNIFKSDSCTKVDFNQINKSTELIINISLSCFCKQKHKAKDVWYDFQLETNPFDSVENGPITTHCSELSSLVFFLQIKTN